MHEGKACRCARRLHWHRDRPVVKQSRRRNRTWAKRTEISLARPLPSHSPSFCPLSDGARMHKRDLFLGRSGKGNRVLIWGTGAKEGAGERTMARISTSSCRTPSSPLLVTSVSSLLVLCMTCYDATHTHTTYIYTYTTQHNEHTHNYGQFNTKITA